MHKHKYFVLTRKPKQFYQYAPTHHACNKLNNCVTSTFDLLNFGSMYAKQRSHTIGLLSLMLTAQAVFLLEPDKQTHTETQNHRY